ncbi:hypothetical protein GHT06_014395 [Daphnia sinensis]|uniref:Uncharacterized protein n=1 Tax=Daphnia sinensis TaxID=1820382 RepID=A0AAD5LDS3_9CRUS|nr:hypothetical protein GHT06_014395 [Daphnia sinensis]
MLLFLARVSKVARMLASNEDHQQCKINGLENHISFYTLCPLIISCKAPYISTLTANTRLRLARSPVFASPVVPSSPRPSSRLRLARRPVFAPPVVPSSPRPSSRLRLTRRLVVAPSSPRHCGIIVFCNM